MLAEVVCKATSLLLPRMVGELRQQTWSRCPTRRPSVFPCRTGVLRATKPKEPLSELWCAR